MNQNILFSDDATWSDESASIQFTGQQQGMNIRCYIGLSALGRLSQQTILNQQQAMKVFDEYRFDIEELAEQLIEQEVFDEQGRIWITA
ncbi:DUF1488 domain-containing protein [Shewanella sp. Isolate11]|uniref:DUF1488 domain-containing protein n=1 Tax=Shewanella sp. Isolate11 TaxID=2908530 RepID=UPI001EFE5A43|nr:DUF1488 domain-containing protein [Shewanella sp. Isolate11]MCG9698374.1 DUF1488 domain-containing protein [Shewanella sp. Isolate11]